MVAPFLSASKCRQKAGGMKRFFRRLHRHRDSALPARLARLRLSLWSANEDAGAGTWSATTSQPLQLSMPGLGLWLSNGTVPWPYFFYHGDRHGASKKQRHQRERGRWYGLAPLDSCHALKPETLPAGRDYAGDFDQFWLSGLDNAAVYTKIYSSWGIILFTYSNYNQQHNNNNKTT